MAQHFLLSKAAKTLSLASVFTMKDADAENVPPHPLGRYQWRAGLPALRRR